MARPTLAPESAHLLSCVRCRDRLQTYDFGAGTTVHACTRCRAVFVPPRGWARAFSARDVVGDFEARLGRPEQNALGPLAGCPICARQMDRTRFAATSEVVIDACSAGHGVWLASGDLGRAVDYAAHKARIGDQAAAREADAAWMKANNVDPRRHAIETEETRIRAASSARLATYAKRGTFGVAVLVLIRVLLLIASKQNPKHPTTAAATVEPASTIQQNVQQAGEQSAEDLKR